MLPWKITARLRPGCQVVLKPFQQRASNSSNTTSVRAVFVVSHCALLSRTLIMSKPFSFQFVTHNLWHISNGTQSTVTTVVTVGRTPLCLADIESWTYTYIYLSIYLSISGGRG